MGMWRSDWPKAVDARLTTQPEESVISASSESRGGGAGQKESPLGIREGSGKKGDE